MFRQAWVIALLAVAISAHPNLPSDTQPNSPSSSQPELAVNKAAELEKKSYTDFYGCLNDVADIDQLKTEFEGAKSNRSELHGVTKKYCAKTTQLKTCVHTYLDGNAPSTNGQKAYFTKNLIDQVIDYSCYNDGERITSFISEKGIECLLAQGATNLEQCAQQSLASLSAEDRRALIESGTSVNPARVNYCGYTDQWMGCLLTSFKTCNPPTSSNILESLNSFIHKNSVCNDALPNN